MGSGKFQSRKDLGGELARVNVGLVVDSKEESRILPGSSWFFLVRDHRTCICDFCCFASTRCAKESHVIKADPPDHSEVRTSHVGYCIPRLCITLMHALWY